MTTPRRGLGRGLGALIPSAVLAESGEADSAAIPGVRLLEIPVSDIKPNPRQPRQVFDEDALDELAHSLREVGVLQPLVVRPSGAGYELVMGERRWRAAIKAGLPTVPAIVRQTADDAMLRDALLENLHREQLNPLEEAAAYAQLLDEFGVTHDELARRIGRSRSHVTNTIRLLGLTPSVQRRVAAGVLSAGHARALLALEDPAAQEELAQRIVAEGLSVRTVEELVAMGDVSGKRKVRTPRRPRPVAPAAAELAARLGDRLETRVKVQLGRNRGRLTIEFASVDDLERIVGVIAPELIAERKPAVS